MNQSKFSVPEAAGNSNASVTEESAVPFPPASPQFPLGSFACSSLSELVFMIRSPARLTEKGQLAVYKVTCADWKLQKLTDILWNIIYLAFCQEIMIAWFVQIGTTDHKSSI